MQKLQDSCTFVSILDSRGTNAANADMPARLHTLLQMSAGEAQKLQQPETVMPAMEVATVEPTAITLIPYSLHCLQCIAHVVAPGELSSIGTQVRDYRKISA